MLTTRNFSVNIPTTKNTFYFIFVNPTERRREREWQQKRKQRRKNLQREKRQKNLGRDNFAGKFTGGT
ncbi:MAG: hypothetical protein A3C43_01160 [Candidatus Schekmanbacteria bacterium RIFCSPHIGHO2_02_FULL_38_11]|nr:MAG: hypothetical protein A2043_07655 [Candidatus Schekmanbacteria bacterium GWA2_38_9]OGL52713.1 MAG: hypothetical protein A3C43_01160 [Candidatus Schekmanbacteria bacterium RIFCSPHIGHO2_02_FULL_38_11]